MRLIPRGALLALLCLIPGSTRAAVVHGTVHLPQRSSSGSAPAMNPYPGRAGSMAGMHENDRGLMTDAVVYVDHVPARAESVLAANWSGHPKLAQKDQSFVPRVVVIAAGTRVDFPNMDPIFHNVFSLSPARRFDLGKYPRGNSRQVLFTKPGLVNVYCDIHSDMEAFILVLPHHAFTRPSASGEFELPDLPSGHYALHVWHPDFGEHTTDIVVPQDGDVIANVDY
jgi:plastocyanin